MNEPDFEQYKNREEGHKKRIKVIKKELQSFSEISEKTLNKRFTI